MIEWVPQGQTVEQQYYNEVLRKFRGKGRKKRQCLQSNNTWVLHQDNASVHIVLSVKQLLVEKRNTVLENQPYSPDLAPYDLYLFLKVKNVLMGAHFLSVGEMKVKTTEDGNA
ncbi:HTH_48 domain-containing protein [Trichonephila clavipes]|nr:HTH_48 domain-containing protein [Trichonephila clavipes]